MSESLSGEITLNLLLCEPLFFLSYAKVAELINSTQVIMIF